MIQVPNNRKGKKFIANLQKPAKKEVIEKDLGHIPGAIELLEKLQKEVVSLKQRLDTVESQMRKYVAVKQQERRRDHD